MQSVVIYRSDRFTLTSYGNGNAYEILRNGSGGDCAFLQGDDTDTFREQFDKAEMSAESERNVHDLLAEYFGA